MAMGTVWAGDTWAADTWEDDTWSGAVSGIDYAELIDRGSLMALLIDEESEAEVLIAKAGTIEILRDKLSRIPS